MDILYIIVPAYNEEENIEKLIDDWYPIVEKHSGGGLSRLAIVNDGSQDRTGEILSSLAGTHPLLAPLSKPNGGHGSAVLYGYRYALSQEADYIFQTDSDGQTDPAGFEAFWDLRKDYHAIFGSRSARGDGFARAMVEKILCLILWLIFGVKLPDANAPFRLMNADYLSRFLPKMPPDYDLPNVLLTTFGVYYQEPITFRDITFQPRRGGTNSLNARRIVRMGLKALKDFRKIKKDISKNGQDRRNRSMPLP